MEFWGVEVKPGETVKCGPGENRYLHLSQASLGETKKDKGSENVPLFVKFDDQKLVLGTLSGDKCAQIQYDLVFEKELELSHSSKNASVYFCGYKTAIDEHDHELDGYSDFDSDEEEFELAQAANGKASLAELGKAKVAKADGSSDKLKAKAKAVQALKDDKPTVDEDSDDDDDDDDSDEEDSDEDSDGLEIDDEDDIDGEEDDSDEEEEETPKKVEVGKKRGAASGPKTPVPEKKAKLVSPAGGQKTGGDSKKSEHTATPHPAKKVGKKTTPADDGKLKQQSPKSGGSVTCKSCSKTFNSDNAFQAHSKAKHSAAK